MDFEPKFFFKTIVKLLKINMNNCLKKNVLFLFAANNFVSTFAVPF